MIHTSREADPTTPRARRRPAALPLMLAAGLGALTTGMTFAAPSRAAADTPAAPAKPDAPKPGAKPEAKPAATAAAPVQKVVLRYKAEAGQIKRTAGTGVYTFDGNAAARVQVKSTTKYTYKAVDAKTGEITYEDATESQEVTFPNGQTQKQEKPDVSTVVIRPNGTLVSLKDNDPAAASKPDAKESAELDARVFVAGTVVFPDTPVGVGDKWGHDYKPDPALGTREAHADFEVLSASKIGGNDALKIRMTYAEKGDKAITSKVTFLIEQSSGDEIASEFQVDGIAFPEMGVARAVGGGQRTEGGPIAASKNDPAAVKVAMTTGGGPGGAAEAKKDKTIDEVVKDGFEKMPGLVTLYRKKADGRDQIFLELREDQLGKLMLLQATASTGTADTVIAGDPIDDLVFKFVKQGDDKLILNVPNWYFRADPNTPIAKAVRRSFADALIQSFRVEAKQAERKSLLIDVSDLFKGDLSQISRALSGGGLLGIPGSGGGGFGIDREKTYIDWVKNFPENLAVRTQYAFLRGGRDGGPTLADDRGATLGVVFNLSALPVDENYQPTNGFKPRLADPRVGYFQTGYVDFSDDSKRDLNVRYIQRWNLQKKDPNAALSEPVKPIVFYLDDAIPTEYRQTVRDAILVWNRAYEKVGFKDAVQVKDIPQGADIDTADMRYNFIRWVVSPVGGSFYGTAIALARVNPLTGEVLNASISVDSSWTREGKLERRDTIDPATAFRFGAGMDMDDLLSAARTNPDAFAQSPAALSLERTLRDDDPRHCRHGAEAHQNAWAGAFAVDMLGLISAGETAAAVGGGAAGAAAQREQEYTQQLIFEVVAHEMGHILGLRHNFAASAAYTLDQLKDPKFTAKNGVSASMMDYNAFNISALRRKGVPFYQNVLGSYDNWAIEYGYREFAGDVKKPEDELPALRRIATQSNKPGNTYQDDLQSRFGWDPRVASYDLSADPLAYFGKMMDLSRYLLVNLDKRLPGTGESYWEFTRAFNALLSNYSRAAGQASRYVGGLYANRNHKGDPGQRPALMPVDGKKQKDALALLNTYIFAPTALQFPERYYTYLTANPNPTSVRDILSADQPVLDKISGIQKTALTRLFSPAVLARVANNEFKLGGDPTKALTLTTLFSSVGGNVWADLGSAKLPTLRRQLQRSWLDTMCDMALKGGVPDDARMLAWDQLKQVRPRLMAAQKTASGDTYTRVHVADSLSKIDRTLRADVEVSGGSAGGGGGLLQMLLGGKQQPK